ncbi:MAG TPA: ABC transporter ATP-binding protein, partial [Thermomicrobiales bacterium]|nr:ABC transporter ATP-binding protein [Thermomicrobiales bacterium]
IGVMLQQDGLHPGLTARGILALYANFYPDPADPDPLLARVGLTAAAATRCRRLSGGQKRRLALALALVGRPALVFLDAPTTGMDPQARLATWEIVRELRAEGTTILLTTHFMEEAERLADRVAIVDHGRLVALDTPGSLTRDEQAGGVRLVAAPGLDTLALGALPGARGARETEPGVYALDAAPDEVAGLLAEVTAWLRDRGVTLTELRVGHGSLEEAFLRLTGREERP